MPHHVALASADVGAEGSAVVVVAVAVVAAAAAVERRDRSHRAINTSVIAISAGVLLCMSSKKESIDTFTRSLL